MIHFNRSLSSVAVCRWMERVKRGGADKIVFSLPNGGVLVTGDTVVIRRSDVLRVHDYALYHCCPRDYLLIRVLMTTGLRTTEVCTLRLEDIDFQSCTVNVLDSKRHKRYSLPWDMLTLQLIKDLCGDRQRGFVFRRLTKRRDKSSDEPLSRKAVYLRIRQIGMEAGVEGFHPRVLRQFFAAMYYYGDPDLPEDKRRRGNLGVLQVMMRHKRPSTTLDYVTGIVFFEDIQREYQRVVDSWGVTQKRKKEVEKEL